MVVKLRTITKGGETVAKLCFFIGHRECPYAIRGKLDKAVEHVIREKGIQVFVVGQYGNFDQMAASAVKGMKHKYSDISLWLLLPYHPSERPIEATEGFDGTYYPEGQEFVPKRIAIVKANQTMVDQCDVLIAYAKGPGNSRNLVEYAERKDVEIINLAKKSEEAREVL